MLATNLAVAAARSGLKTLLVDLDLQFGDSALTLAMSPRATIADLTASGGDVDGEKLQSFITTDDADGSRRAARASASGAGGCRSARPTSRPFSTRPGAPSTRS